jgi:glucose/arabinose dehydrogenase
MRHGWRRFAGYAVLAAACLILTGSPSRAADRVGVHRPQTGQWFLELNNNGAWDGCGFDGCLPQFGVPTDLPVAGDWTGSGVVRVGVFRPQTGQWFLDQNNNGAWDGCGVDGCLPQFGVPTDLPVAGDWTGSGVARVGVFRPQTGEWFLDLDGDGAWDGCGVDGCLPQFGAPTDLPVAGDWTGSGVTRVGVFRPQTGQWFLDLDGDGIWDGCGVDGCLPQFGAPTDLPVTGDWTGSGMTRIGVFRPQTGQWFLDLDGDGAWDGCGVDGCLPQFGATADRPIAGDWSFATTWPQLSLVRIASGFVEPVHLTHAGDGSGRLFVVERSGRIRIIRNGAILPVVFLDLTPMVGAVGGEQGLLSVAFPPGFAGKGYFCVDYTDLAGNTVVARYRLGADPDIADAGSGETLLAVLQPFATHNGGQLAFGPDGFLYVALGDGGSAGDPFDNAQNLGSLLGKILRLDVEAGIAPYAIPPDNPFGNEIWALGLRNPWRFSFDRSTGDLYLGDVGQAAVEEVDFQPAAGPGGQNYGWNIMEGSTCFGTTACDRTGLTLPVFEYGHAGGDCSVTGGFVFRGQAFPSLQGIYLLGDFCSGRIRGVRRAGAGWEGTLLLDTTLSISTFGEDEAGNLYVADFGTGDIYQIVVLGSP